MAEYINREELLANLQTMESYNTSPMYRRGYDDCVATILKAPAADVVPVVQWIPANEELPPEGTDVLCWYEYFRYGSYNRMYQTFGIGYQFNGHWGGEIAQGQNTRVMAWMPLPDPPKEKIDG